MANSLSKQESLGLQTTEDTELFKSRLESFFELEPKGIYQKIDKVKF